MKMTYETDADTLRIQVKTTARATTRELGANTVLEIDANGDVCAVIIAKVSEGEGDGCCEVDSGRLFRHNRGLFHALWLGRHESTSHGSLNFDCNIRHLHAQI